MTKEKKGLDVAIIGLRTAFFMRFSEIIGIKIKEQKIKYLVERFEDYKVLKILEGLKKKHNQKNNFLKKLQRIFLFKKRY